MRNKMIRGLAALIVFLLVAGAVVVIVRDRAKIAELERQLADRQQTVDKETGPNTNSENGDGFTLFEEYRGFLLLSIDPSYSLDAAK